jgi:hypothetical protein
MNNSDLFNIKHETQNVEFETTVSKADFTSTQLIFLLLQVRCINFFAPNIYCIYLVFTYFMLERVERTGGLFQV